MFQNEKIDELTFKITGSGCDSYLLLGDEQAIMIDSGCDENNIVTYAQTLTTLPLTLVINTHSHFDHTGGNGFFPNIYMSKDCRRSAKNYMDEDPTNLIMDYQIKEIQEGIFKFAGRELFIIELNCHSPGNIAILDKQHRLLFVGDEIDHDQVLLLPGFAEKSEQLHSCPAATVFDYQQMLLKLKSYENDFDYLCCGHNGSPLDKTVLDIMLEICEQILSGKKGNPDCSSATYNESDTHYPYADANYLRYTWKGYSLVYCDDDLFERSRNSKREPATFLHALCAKTTEYLD